MNCVFLIRLSIETSLGTVFRCLIFDSCSVGWSNSRSWLLCSFQFRSSIFFWNNRFIVSMFITLSFIFAIWTRTRIFRSYRYRYFFCAISRTCVFRSRHFSLLSSRLISCQFNVDLPGGHWIRRISVFSGSWRRKLR